MVEGLVPGQGAVMWPWSPRGLKLGSLTSAKPQACSQWSGFNRIFIMWGFQFSDNLKTLSISIFSLCWVTQASKPRAAKAVSVGLCLGSAWCQLPPFNCLGLMRKERSRSWLGWFIFQDHELSPWAWEISKGPDNVPDLKKNVNDSRVTNNNS